MKRLRIFARFILALFAALALPVADLHPESDPNASSSPWGFAQVGKRVVFFLRDSSLWTTNGTPAGTRRLTGDAPPAATVGLVGGAYLWFAQQPQSVISLWRTGGLPATTYPLVANGIVEPEPDDYPIPWAINGGRLYFFRQSDTLELWTSDGTVAGTRRAASLPQVNNPPQLAVSSQGTLFFFTARRRPGIGSTGYDRWAVWRSDGTTAGTRRLASLPDYALGIQSTPRRLIFLSGHQLWASDGSVNGTAPIFGPPADPALEVHGFLGTAGDKLYFLAHTGAQSETLWVSDGTRRGTGIVSPTLSPAFPGAATLGDRISFVASDGLQGFELWSSRGTARTTTQVADLCPGACSAFTGSPSLVATAGRIFFMAADPAHGRELFVSDGTKAGTRRVLDLCPGPCGFSAGLTPVGGEVYFYARDPTNGVELWASDGTPGGTRRLSDFTPAEIFDTALPLPAPSLAILGNQVVSTGYDPQSGFEPWVFDRAGGGGHLLADLFQGGAAHRESGAAPRAEVRPPTPSAGSVRSPSAASRSSPHRWW